MTTLFASSAAARRLALVCALLAPAALGCTEEDPAPLYIQLDYQLRCIDCEPRSTDSPARELALVDGEEGTSLDCRVDVIGGKRLLTFEVEGPGYGLSLRQLDLDAPEPGGECVVSVDEGTANQYEGRCRAFGVAGTEPCEVQLMEDDGVISGFLKCTRIKHRTTMEYTRYVVKPGTSEPAEFEVRGCRGL